MPKTIHTQCAVCLHERNEIGPKTTHLSELNDTTQKSKAKSLSGKLRGQFEFTYVFILFLMEDIGCELRTAILNIFSQKLSWQRVRIKFLQRNKIH